MTMLAERALRLGTRVLNKNYLNGDISATADILPKADPDARYMLYMHIPFCKQLCTYCSFNRFYHKEDRTRDYFVSLRRELEMVKELGYRFDATYIGGGTPTVLLDELVGIIDYAKELFPDIKDVSTETNPTDLGDELFDALTPRVDRLSVGVQSFDNDLLRYMSRYKTTGSAEETLAAVQSIQGKFDSFNVDMIFNFPTQTFEGLQRDLDLVLQTGCNQTTFYPLLASPLRRKQMAKDVGKVDFKREYEMYKMVCDILYGAGFVGSSAWTFSASKDMIIDEYIVDYPEYVGIGAGAMSYLQGQNYTNAFGLRDYHAGIAAGKMPIASMTQSAKSKTVDMRYYFATKLFGLRLDKQEFRERFGVDIAKGLPVEMTFMRANGAFAIDDENELTLTDKGRYLTLVMMRETLAGSNDYRDQMRADLNPDEYRELLDEDAQ
ncbi:MAG: coproporphyrinogen III oxidase family protein [Coriobacteriia bacterium]|nr:coproporphyrinogen III oxidase family protein [Coriobacteriia bacterium]